MTSPATQGHEDDVLGKAYDRKLMSRLLVYGRPYRALMFGAFALLCVEGGIQVVGPLLTRRVIDVAVPARDTRRVRSGPMTWMPPSTHSRANAPNIRAR